jgi:DNA polymerase I-like protein with 3'-5' exonuclease and polymerase domains
MRLEIALLPVLVRIEVVGCRIDKEKWLYTARYEWKKLHTEYEDSLDAEIRELAKGNSNIPKKYLRTRRRGSVGVVDIFGNVTEVSNENLGNINYGSSAQILELFDILGQPIPQVKNGDEVKNSVGEDALLTYIAEYPRTKMRRFIELLLKYREFEKLISTYGEEFLAKLDGKGYIHTEYTQCFTDTGRLSSKNPNLQNIPATDLEKDGYNIRQYFIPDPDEVWITADMEAAEVRIAADYSGDQMLVDSLMKDLDLHSILSSGSYSIIFGQDVTISKSKEKIKIKDKEFVLQTLRDTHKSVLFAKFYKGGAKRVYEVLAEYINLFNKNGMKIADRISKLVDSKLPRLSEYLSGLITEAKEKGFLRGSKLGRIRYFNPATVYGDAANFPIQNTNGEAMKIALIRMDKYFRETGYGRILMTVHDEMSVSARKDKAKEVAEVLKKVMADALGWFLGTIPGKSSVSIGENWASK